MDTDLLYHLAPTSPLTVKHTHHTTALVYIPYFKQAAKHPKRDVVELAYELQMLEKLYCYSISSSLLLTTSIGASFNHIS